MAEDPKTKLTQYSGHNFFDALEIFMKANIPKLIRNILLLNGYNCAFMFSKFDASAIDDIQHCMRNTFDKDFLGNNESLADYLGKFVKKQEKFIFFSGEIRLLRSIAEFCQQLYKDQPLVTTATSLNSCPINESDAADKIEEVLDVSLTDDKLLKSVGSYMFTIFNDAKRTTLSGHSWPSRHIATEMANNFKHGCSSSSNLNLQYLTPTFHAEFLDCIVLSDIDNFRDCIKKSLAVSLRLDGSVDKTQKHNVFVMIQIVKPDASMKNLCIGFDVPETDGAKGYLDCLKKISNKVLPWDEFFALITSIVTDGENLNLGRFNGLVAKLKDLRNLTGTNLPLISIWCVPHRTNLAWKDVSKINSISNIISRTTKLSKYFRKSGKRTNTLATLAAANNLSSPLRYPPYFEVRWIEFVYNLCNAVLRNWRATIKYFQSENIATKLREWLQYDRVHFLTFLTDVLGLLKRFQKSCQSNTISLIDVLQLTERLFAKLERCKGTHVDGGWEELFLQKIVTNDDNVSLYGITLNTISNARSRRNGISFNTNKRTFIIDSLIQNLKSRLQLDTALLTAFQPLIEITSNTTQDKLKLCHQTIAPDFDINIFVSDYYNAALLLHDCESNDIHEYLRRLIQSSDELQTMKIALSRILVAKPHSADVERLISVYNKFKNSDRSLLSQNTLTNYLYINSNMGSLEDFDPTAAAQFWITKKKRHTKSNSKSKQQTWFNGVYNQLEIIVEKKVKPKIMF